MKRMKRIAALVMAAALIFALAACGEAREEQGGTTYDQVMARFNGELEEGAVVKVLENDTAVELGYVEELINAFNEAYADQGISAERMNTDQYSDLASDGPYGYGPDVWYQANDIIMQYAENQHILPLPIDSLGYADQIPDSAWNAYALNVDGATYYCGVPINVQTGMLYYIESMLPDNWETDWDVNANGTPDFFETYTALYAFSKETQENGGKTEYGYLDELVDTYFMTGYLFTFGGYVFGENNTNPEDIGLAAGDAAQGAWMIRQWAELMNNTEIVAKDFASSAYSYLAKGKMLCTVTTPDVRSMFIKEMVNNGWTEEEAEADLKMIAVPRLPASGDLTADAWQDTITNMDELTLETKMMGGMNGYGISSYTKCPNAALAFVKFAADYEQVVLRNEMLGITPARADAEYLLPGREAPAGEHGVHHLAAEVREGHEYHEHYGQHGEHRDAHDGQHERGDIELPVRRRGEGLAEAVGPAALRRLPRGVQHIPHVGDVEGEGEDEHHDGEEAHDEHLHGVVALYAEPEVLLLCAQREDAREVLRAARGEVHHQPREAEYVEQALYYLTVAELAEAHYDERELHAPGRFG